MREAIEVIIKCQPLIPLRPPWRPPWDQYFIRDIQGPPLGGLPPGDTPPATSLGSTHKQTSLTSVTMCKFYIVVYVLYCCICFMLQIMLYMYMVLYMFYMFCFICFMFMFITSCFFILNFSKNLVK